MYHHSVRCSPESDRPLDSADFVRLDHTSFVCVASRDYGQMLRPRIHRKDGGVLFKEKKEAIEKVEETADEEGSGETE